MPSVPGPVWAPTDARRTRWCGRGATWSDSRRASTVPSDPRPTVARPVLRSARGSCSSQSARVRWRCSPMGNPATVSDIPASDLRCRARARSASGISTLRGQSDPAAGARTREPARVLAGPVDRDVADRGEHPDDDRRAVCPVVGVGAEQHPRRDAALVDADDDSDGVTSWAGRNGDRAPSGVVAESVEGTVDREEHVVVVAVGVGVGDREAPRCTVPLVDRSGATCRRTDLHRYQRARRAGRSARRWCRECCCAPSRTRIHRWRRRDRDGRRG